MFFLSSRLLLEPLASGWCECASLPFFGSTFSFFVHNSDQQPAAAIDFQIRMSQLLGSSSLSYLTLVNDNALLRPSSPLLLYFIAPYATGHLPRSM
jgi:hypothetical protein